MKKIECIIRPHQLEMVKSDLLAFGIQGMTVYEVQGFGRQKGHQEMYRGNEYMVDFVPKVKLEILADEEQADAIVDIIKKAAYTGKIGDGKIYVSSVESMIRIRTGETGPDAI
ncbi:MAG: P-II family nitrogen regulator [Candidatus Sumerlaeaceae bacterium]